MYLDLVGDFLHAIAYSAFFVVLFHSYGLPLHIIRDVYATLTSFYQRCVDVMRYRAAVRRLESFENVTPAQLTQMSDDKCAVCFDHMLTTAKRLPCGHCFHFGCLRSWLEQRQVCPVCNANVLDDRVTQVGGMVFAPQADAVQLPQQQQQQPDTPQAQTQAQQPQTPHNSTNNGTTNTTTATNTLQQTHVVPSSPAMQPASSSSTSVAVSSSAATSGDNGNVLGAATTTIQQQQHSVTSNLPANIQAISRLGAMQSGQSSAHTHTTASWPPALPAMGLGAPIPLPEGNVNLSDVYLHTYYSSLIHAVIASSYQMNAQILSDASRRAANGAQPVPTSSINNQTHTTQQSQQ
eukprot:c97_g1_i1.p1 GENE.c97_g1_i1~~c97_g1_i1.p1  ORF type:complete len:350 (-),score=104.97 c97_g1_i1:179-1228(-)